jgi:hypothetical protein
MSYDGAAGNAGCFHAQNVRAQRYLLKAEFFSQRNFF